ncbi:MAG: hypothetical protein M1828_004349 [Chrysothrix sp. TS-e1954]|nr:MAG: hypothetical protein M1828_004349 [Chrysothrix sp. TS-e1954]
MACDHQIPWNKSQNEEALQDLNGLQDQLVIARSTLPSMLKTLALPCELPEDLCDPFEVAAHGAIDSLAQVRSYLASEDIQIALRTARSSWILNRERGWEILGHNRENNEAKSTLTYDGETVGDRSSGVSGRSGTFLNKVEQLSIKSEGSLYGVEQLDGQEKTRREREDHSISSFTAKHTNMEISRTRGGQTISVCGLQDMEGSGD